MIEGGSGPRGIIVGAPSTGSGKTSVTLALSVLLMRRGLSVSTAKIGPDYIDPQFHFIATGRPCRNLDDWAMRPATIAAIIERSAAGADILLIEGVMGLFDGAPTPARVPEVSTASMARLTGLPIIVVVGARGMGTTAGAILAGLKNYDSAVNLAGVIFNQVSGERHRAILEIAARHAGIPALGFLPAIDDLRLPSRHLGLVQASEFPDFEERLGRLAEALDGQLDLDRLLELAAPIPAAGTPGVIAPTATFPVLGQRIALARDDAFSFAYPAMIEGWRESGAEIHPFSPLADEAPDGSVDAIFLPGGYPELHAGRLASNRRFLDGLSRAAGRGAVIYGECGGYMVLGRALLDAQGEGHAMAGLLPVETSFAKRKLHLGYRLGTLAANGPLGRKGTQYRGHEFHYASIVRQDGEDSLFQVNDARCREIGSQGRRQGSVMGSFLHLIDRA